MGPVNTNNSTANNMANDSNSNSVSNVKPLRVVLNLVSLKFVDAGIRLKASEKLSLNMHRHIFERTHAALLQSALCAKFLNLLVQMKIHQFTQPPTTADTFYVVSAPPEPATSTSKDDTTPSSIVASPNRTLDKTTNSEATQHIFDETDSSLRQFLRFFFGFQLQISQLLSLRLQLQSSNQATKGDRSFQSYNRTLVESPTSFSNCYGTSFHIKFTKPIIIYYSHR